MILVFGSLNVDLVFPVVRLPRPGETVLTSAYERLPGGKGANQAVAAARAGARVAMAGAVGADGFGELMVDTLRREGIDVTGIHRRADAPTGCASIAVEDGGENVILVASGANHAIGAEAVSPETLTGADWLLLQGEMPIGATTRMLHRARDQGLKTCLNLAPYARLALEDLSALDLLILNRGEAEALARQLALRADPALAAAQAIAHTIGGACLITLGGDGAVLATPEALMHLAPLAISPVDTTGAGDAFVGALMAALDAGRDWPDCLRRATVAGALACTARGAQSALPTADAIARELPRLPELEYL